MVVKHKTKGVPVATGTFTPQYQDTGCKYAPACLTCPFVVCVHNNPEAFKKEVNGAKKKEKLKSFSLFVSKPSLYTGH